MDDLEHVPDTPFASIESAQQYLVLLRGTVEEATDEIETALSMAIHARAAKREQALRLASFHLFKFKTHMIGSLRALNDLRTLRRLIFAERAGTQSVEPEPQPSEV